MMNNLKILVLFVAIMTTLSAQAGDDIVTLNFKQAVQKGYDEGILDKSIHYYLQGQSHPEVIKNHGMYKSNKKTNGVGKSAEKSCNWVLLSVLKAYQKRAQDLGANAIINIKSNYKSNEYVDDENFQCGNGMIMSGVALKGDVATLK